MAWKEAFTIDKIDITSFPAVRNRTALVLLAGTLCALTVLSLCIPLFTRMPDRAGASISNPKLFPLYYQTNSDAPIGMQSSLGFPFFFRESQYRVNRPLLIGLIAGARVTVMPILRVLLPEKTFSAMWGDQSAIEVLVTYFGWNVLNVLFIGSAALLLFGALKPLLGQRAALVAALLLLSAPITLLSMREITEGSVQILLASASLFFWRRVLMEKATVGCLLVLSLGVGFLFLGKLAVTTFFAGILLCLFSQQRKKLGLIIPCAILPSLCWIGVLLFLGIPFSVNELNSYQPVLSSFVSQTSLSRIPHFALSWLAVLREDGLVVQLPFALLGLYQLYKNKFPLLRVVPVFAGVDFCFFLALDRAHAVYGIHTMIFYYPAVAVGILTASRWIAVKVKIPIVGNNEPLVAAIILMALQASLIARTIPTYGG